MSTAEKPTAEKPTARKTRNENKEPAREFGFLVAEVARLMRKRFNDAAAQVGLTLAQARVLVYLDRNEGISQKALAEILEIQPITLLRQVDRLAESDLLERRPNPTDRRAQCLYLTRNGRTVLEAVWKFGRAVNSNAFDGVDIEDRAAMEAVLTTVRDNLSVRDRSQDREEA